MRRTFVSVVILALIFCPYVITQPYYGTSNAKKLQGVPISPTAPTNGQCPVYNSTTGMWEPGACSGSSGGGGVFYCEDAGSSDTYTCSLATIGVSGSTATALTAYTKGLSFWFNPNTTSTVAAAQPSVNVNGLGARNILTDAGGTPSDGYLVGTGDVLYWLYYDGAAFRVYGSSGLLPNATGKEWSSLTSTDGVYWSATFKGGKPSSGAQTIDAATDVISPDREYIEVSLNANYTLGTTTDTIADGAFNGERITVTNTTNFTLTLQDISNFASSNLCLGGSNLTVGYRGSATLIWNLGLGCWVRAVTTSSITTVPVTFTLPFCSFATATATTGSGGNGWSKAGSGSLTTIGIDSNGTNCWTPFAAAYAGEAWVNLASVLIPAGWDGNAPSITFIHWLTTSSTMVAGERVDWLVSVACMADGESGAPTFNATNTFSTTYPASPAGKRYFITETDQDVTGCAAGELMAIKYIRSASDTGSQVAMGRGIVLTFRVTP
jgi:hypothetical protein